MPNLSEIKEKVASAWESFRYAGMGGPKDVLTKPTPIGELIGKPVQDVAKELPKPSVESYLTTRASAIAQDNDYVDHPSKRQISSFWGVGGCNNPASFRTNANARIYPGTLFAISGRQLTSGGCLTLNEAFGTKEKCAGDRLFKTEPADRLRCHQEASLFNVAAAHASYPTSNAQYAPWIRPAVLYCHKDYDHVIPNLAGCTVNFASPTSEIILGPENDLNAGYSDAGWNLDGSNNLYTKPHITGGRDTKPFDIHSESLDAVNGVPTLGADDLNILCDSVKKHCQDVPHFVDSQAIATGGCPTGMERVAYDYRSELTGNVVQLNRCDTPPPTTYPTRDTEPVGTFRNPNYTNPTPLPTFATQAPITVPPTTTQAPTTRARTNPPDWTEVTQFLEEVSETTTDTPQPISHAGALAGNAALTTAGAGLIAGAGMGAAAIGLPVAGGIALLGVAGAGVGYYAYNRLTRPAAPTPLATRPETIV